MLQSGENEKFVLPVCFSVFVVRFVLDLVSQRNVEINDL